MGEPKEQMQALVEYTTGLQGYEKGEAQVFCDRLFQAFGHEGYKEANATLEFRVKKRGGGRGRKFADLLWAPRVLIEMKSRGERLERHYDQAFDYWLELVPERPQYVVLCNFDEFWIYDFNTQLDSPIDKVGLTELPERYTALNFLFPDERRPVFNNDKVQVTREAADKVAQVFNALVEGGESREAAQRFILQCVVAMFSEDFDLLPRDFFTELLTECAEGASAYDLIGGLFRQMGTEKPARGGRFLNVRYFNGGLFETVEPAELGRSECALLLEAAREQWSKVAPPIFGTLFQGSMDKARRHAMGAHFTHEADIQEIVRPTIVRPWREKVARAKTLNELEALAKAILDFRVLDPACGSGNFLYVAYRELVGIELEILRRIHEEFKDAARQRAGSQTLVSTKQFFGIDKDPFAVELAKVTLMLSKRIAVAEGRDRHTSSGDLGMEIEEPLPLDNLDESIVAGDALFCDWPKVDVIIGNPPFQSKNKMQKELGRAYVNRVRDRYPEVPGRADYCVYWFRRAHDELQEGQRAGLVGTNTIRQNYSREGGLEYIVDNGGAINQAWSSKVWSGDADVHVAIVNWSKGGREVGDKVLFRQEGDNLDSPLRRVELDRIAATLSSGVDVTKARKLACNAKPKTTHQGQTHGHKGFLLAREEAEAELARDERSREVLFPFLTIDEVLRAAPPRIERYVIDFHPRGLLAAQEYPRLFYRVQAEVLPAREKAAGQEDWRNAEAVAESPEARTNRHHANFLAKWWQLSYPRQELMAELGAMKRYVACGQVTKRPVFVFVPTHVHPNAALQVFTFDDDYSFGVLQSAPHWEWFNERCSTLTERPRYTSTTVYDSFPWPQSPALAQVRKVAKTGRELRLLRRDLMKEHGLSLRDLYRSLELPGKHPLKDAHDALEQAVRAAYGMTKKEDAVGFLFKLNQQVSEAEKAGEEVVRPGIPPCVNNRDELVSDDAMEFE